MEHRIVRDREVGVAHEAGQRGTGRAATLASVVVPAHDEQAVVGRCLEALLAEARPGELEVVVVANGCRDRTADAARAVGRRTGHRIVVLELDRASKPGALRAADAVAGAFPRVYLDADVVCSTQVLRQLVAAVQQPSVELAVPSRELDLSAAGRTAGAYYRTWAQTPAVQGMLAGRGCYVLSRAGRERLGSWPDAVADDRLVATAVPRAAARQVTGTVRITPPADVRSLLAVRTRVYAGNLALGPVAHEDGPGGARTRRGPRRPGAWSDLLVYAAVSAVAHVRARAAVRRGGVEWGRAVRRDPSLAGRA